MAAGVVPQSSCSLKPGRPRPQLLPHPLGRDGVALAQQGDVDRPAVERFQHPGQVPGPGGDGGGLGPLRRPRAPADDRGDPPAEGLLQDLGADEVDVAVDGPRGQDAPVAGDDLGGRADDQRGVDAVHGVGVAGLAQADDAPVPDPDVGLHHAPVVEDDGPGDDRVGRPLGPGGPALPHRLPDDLAPAEDGLVAARRPVLLHLDEQVGVGQPDAVADGGPEQQVVAGPIHRPRRDPAARRPRPGARRPPADPPIGTRSTSRSMPGSKRTAVPAGTASRSPRAAARSNDNAGFASAKW